MAVRSINCDCLVGVFLDGVFLCWKEMTLLGMRFVCAVVRAGAGCDEMG